MGRTDTSFLVVGAGLFGSIVARELHDAGIRVSVVENRKHVGGNCRTYVDDGIVVHEYGAHIFNTNSDDVWRYVNGFVPFLPFKNSPLAVNSGKLYSLPINMLTFNQLWGVTRPDDARKVIASQRVIRDTEPVSVEDAVLSTVGRDVYNILIRDYTEKQWGRPCSELPKSTIRRIPIRYTYDNNYYNARYQGIPVGGYSALFSHLLSGIDVRTSVPVSDSIVMAHHAVRDGVRVIWTGTIDSYFDYVIGRLDYRSLVFEHRKLSTPDFQGNAVVNYCDTRPYTRTIEHKHFMLGSGQQCPAEARTVVSFEYPKSYTDGLDPCYPINDSANSALYEKYADMAKSSGVVFCGRLGGYAYTSMTDTVENALSLSKKLIGEAICQT